jgi:uncharacterized Zn finger protein
MSELHSLGAIYWGRVWLEALRSSAELDPGALDLGVSYARHDHDLEVFVDKGRAEATAGLGRRLPYEVSVTLPVASDEIWEQLIDRIADSSGRTAALLDGHVEPVILDDARSLNADLLPQKGELSWTCGCEQVTGAGRVCKHVGAVLYLLADSFDEDPFELLLLRGRTREELRMAVAEQRSGSSSEPDLDEAAESAWARQRGALPAVPPVDDEPGQLTSWSSDPPPNAPFTADGLREIGTETAERAWHLLAPSTAEDERRSHIDLDLAADLARRAAAVEGSKRWRRLVHHSGLTSQELAARAQAWRVAGADGVHIQLRHRKLHKVSASAQVRQSETGLWFRFEKQSGRWTLQAGPADHPEELLRSTPIG